MKLYYTKLALLRWLPMRGAPRARHDNMIMRRAGTQARKIELNFSIFFHTMRFLLLLSLVGAYRIETVTTVCFFMNKACFQTHAKEVEVEINKPKPFTKENYITHSTVTSKYSVTSIITYKY